MCIGTFSQALSPRFLTFEDKGRIIILTSLPDSLLNLGYEAVGPGSLSPQLLLNWISRHHEVSCTETLSQRQTGWKRPYQKDKDSLGWSQMEDGNRILFVCSFVSREKQKQHRSLDSKHMKFDYWQRKLLDSFLDLFLPSPDFLPFLGRGSCEELPSLPATHPGGTASSPLFPLSSLGPSPQPPSPRPCTSCSPPRAASLPSRWTTLFPK